MYRLHVCIAALDADLVQPQILGYAGLCCLHLWKNQAMMGSAMHAPSCLGTQATATLHIRAFPSLLPSLTKHTPALGRVPGRDALDTGFEVAMACLLLSV